MHSSSRVYLLCSVDVDICQKHFVGFVLKLKLNCVRYQWYCLLAEWNAYVFAVHHVDRVPNADLIIVDNFVYPLIAHYSRCLLFLNRKFRRTVEEISLLQHRDNVLNRSSSIEW